MSENIDELTFVNQICFALIKRASQLDANEMTINQEGVTYLGKGIGDWEIIVRKKTKQAH